MRSIVKILLLLFVCSGLFAFTEQEKPTEIKISHLPQIPTPRSATRPTPFKVWDYSSCLKIEFNYSVGDVRIDILNEDGVLVVQATENSDSNISIEQLPLGRYTICLTVNDSPDLVYTGNFQIDDN